MALTRIRVLNQQSTYNVDRLNANTLVVGGNNITGASGGGIVISSVVYLAANGTPLIANAAPTTGNSVIKIIGSGFAANANVFLNGLLQPSANVTFVDSTELRLNMPPLASNTYSLFTFNTAGAGAIFYSGVRFDPYPIWTTGGYSVYSVPISTQLLVTGYGSGSISFSVASGNTLPSGLSLAANGILSGTTTANTYNFYVNATDSENEITTQQITLTVSFADPYFQYNTLLLSNSSQGSNGTNAFIDSSNNNNTLTVVAGTPYQGSFSPFPTTGTWSNYFNGSSGYFKVGSTAGAISSLFSAGGYITIETWVYATTLRTGTVGNTTYPSILSFVDRMNFGVDNGTPKFYWYSGSQNIISSTIAINLNTWNHIALVFNGSGSNNLKMYVNGVLGVTATFTNLADGGYSDVYVGKEIDNPTSSYWPGYISNLRITNSALYTSNFTPTTTPLTAIANTTLLTCQSNRYVDNSTNAYTVTPTGTIKVQRFNPFGTNLMSYSPSTNSGSIYFDYSSYMSIPNSAALQLDGAAWTIEMWIYPTDFTNYNVPLAKRGTGGDQYQVYLLGGTGVLSFYNGTTAVSSSTAPQLNAWNHIAYTHDGGTLKMFLNGVNVYSGAIVVPSGSAPLWIGTDASGTYNFLGHLSNIRILKGTQLYTSGFTPPAEPLTTITNTSLLLLGANGRIIDATKQNNLRLFGDAKISSSAIKYGTGSMYFDGTGDWIVSDSNNSNALGTGDLTAECWVNVPSISGGYAAIVADSEYANSANGWAIYQNGSNIEVWGPNQQVVAASSALTINTWVHIAWTRSGSSNKIFINGTLIATATNSTSYIGTRYWIGARGPGATSGQYPFTGYIDDVRITNGYARYTANTAAPSGPPILY